MQLDGINKDSCVTCRAQASWGDRAGLSACAGPGAQGRPPPTRLPLSFLLPTHAKVTRWQDDRASGPTAALQARFSVSVKAAEWCEGSGSESQPGSPPPSHGTPARRVPFSRERGAIAVAALPLRFLGASWAAQSSVTVGQPGAQEANLGFRLPREPGCRQLPPSPLVPREASEKNCLVSPAHSVREVLSGARGPDSCSARWTPMAGVRDGGSDMGGSRLLHAHGVLCTCASFESPPVA